MATTTVLSVINMEAIFPSDYLLSTNTEQITRIQKLQKLETEIQILQQDIDDTIIKYSDLENHADAIDYMIAAGSGVIAGIIDIFFVGEFSLTNEKGDWKSSESINKFVKKVAKWQGYKGDDLEGSIKHLEEKFHIASDPNLNDFGGGKQHHLRDFAHHPTIVGLIFSLLTQFTKKCYGTNTQGMFITVPVKAEILIGKNIPEKIFFGTIFWFFHMISDMAGSHTSAGAGTGLPGPIVSLLKEISSIPIFKQFKNQAGNSEFSVWLSKLFNGTLFAKRDANGKIIKETVKNFDLRAELSIVGEIAKQAVPVVINECIVRAAFFIRRVCIELKKANRLEQIDWRRTIPHNNGTINRMLTIATGTFTAIDTGDAAVRAAIKSGGNPPVFVAQFALRINYVGIIRFGVALIKDFSFASKMAREKRIQIETKCSKIIEILDEYQAELQAYISAYLVDYIAVFNEALDKINFSIANDDIDGFIAGNNIIQKKLGYHPQFNSFNEFDAFMQSGQAFKL